MSTRKSFNNANPNTISDQLRKVSFGDILASGHMSRRKVAGVVNPYNLATVSTIVLPDNSKAASIVAAYSRAGGVTGALTVVSGTPATGQIAVAPNGNIVTLGTDAITNLDVQYLGIPDVDFIETYFPVASNAITLPSALTALGVVLLLEAEAVEGTGTGKKIILAPAGAPAAGQAALNAAKSTVAFAAADAVTRARVKLLVAKPSAEQLAVALDTAATVM